MVGKERGHMNQINATINIDPTRMNRPRRAVFAMRYHSVSLELKNVPDDVTSIVFRVFKTDKHSFFDIPAMRRPDGTALVYVIGTCFPDAGDVKYELHAYDSRGNMTALGFGTVSIDQFTESGEPIAPGASVPIMTIFDEDGGQHTIKAVPDGMGGYTTIIDA